MALEDELQALAADQPGTDGPETDMAQEEVVVAVPQNVAETPAVVEGDATTETEVTPVQETSVQAAPVQEAPVQEAPVQETPVQETPVQETPVQETPVQETPVQETPVQETPVQETPVQETPVQETPVQEAPVQEAPVQEAPVQEAPVQEAPVQEAPVQEAPVQEAPVQEAPVQEAPVQEAGKKKAKKRASQKQQDASASDDAEETSQSAGFADLSLHPQVLQAVLQSGYDQPTPVQSQVIPHLLSGRDVLAQSQTGSGKTAAFALPVLSRFKPRSGAVQTLVLAPTRELAVQVSASFETYAEHLSGFNVLAIYGGQDYEHQFRALRRGVDVVVGTPGRVIDHIKRGTLDLSKLKCLVLDEADEMLNMGFLEDVQFVLEQTPEDRQVTLFSATMPGPIREIADKYLVDPARITIKKKEVTAESIRQRAVIVPPREKAHTLARFLEFETTDGVIVFTKTKDTTVRLAEQLLHFGFAATALNGDMPQNVRERTIEQLKDGRLDVLVATDVAARGLDVSRISHVFNFDLPHDSESYIHRIGRTGRAGRSGEAIIFLTPAQRRKLKMIERATRRTIEVVPVPTADDINARRIERFKEQISQTSADKDLTFFKNLIDQYVEESGKPMEMIAAALAEIAQQGRPFLLKDRPRKESRRYEDDDRSGGRDGGRNQSGDGRRRPFGPPEEGMIRYRIEVGRNDGVAPRNIVGAVANEAGIQSDYIGPIKIYPHFSTVDLPEGMPKDVYQTLQRTWVSGKQLKIRPDRGGAPRQDSDSRGRPGGKPGRKPNGKRFGSANGDRPSASGKPGGPGKPHPGKKKKRKQKQD